MFDAGGDLDESGTVTTAVAEEVVRLAAPGSRWLATGHDGGYSEAVAAYNVSVPEGFDRTDLATYTRERRERAGFPEPGPTLLTGVDARHARGGRRGPVTVVATAGVSNPATLPVDGTDERDPVDGGGDSTGAGGDYEGVPEVHDGGPGTVNLLVHADRALADGALATLLGVVVEAKTATLVARTGFPGTTTDAAVVGCRPAGDPAEFAGSATGVGAAARACVREAVGASLDARYAETALPGSVQDAEHGVATTGRATVFDPRGGGASGE
jgi:adenosylcobinamide hydrolase